MWWVCWVWWAYVIHANLQCFFFLAVTTPKCVKASFTIWRQSFRCWALHLQFLKPGFFIPSSTSSFHVGLLRRLSWLHDVYPCKIHTVFMQKLRTGLSLILWCCRSITGWNYQIEWISLYLDVFYHKKFLWKFRTRHEDILEKSIETQEIFSVRQYMMTWKEEPATLSFRILH